MWGRPVTRKAMLLIAAMVGLALVAFVPPFLFRDQATGVPSIALCQLKVEASHGYTIPPGRMQVIHAEAQGPYPYQVEGTVIYRSLFGLHVASAQAYNNETAYDFARSRLVGLVAAFSLLEGLLGLLLVKWR